MPLTLDATAGLVTQTLQEILSECNTRLQELAGSDLDALDPDSPEGVLLGIWAERELILQGGLQDVVDALSVSNAQGAQLRNLAQSVGLPPIPASYSTIAGVIGGTPAADASNTLWRCVETGDFWRAPNGVTIGGAGFVATILTAVEAGPIEASADPTSTFELAASATGVTSFVSTADATLGETDETDPDLRARILRTTGTEAGTEPAINAAILAVPGVTLESRVYVNRTLAVDSNGLPPKSVEAVVVGGSEEAIVQALYDSASISASYSGTTTVAAGTYSGVPIEVKYSRVTEIDLEAEVTLDTTSAEVDLPSGYDDDVETAVAAVTLSVGRDAAPARYYAGILNALPEGSVDEVDVQFREAGSGDPLTATYPIGIRERAVIDAGDVTVVVVP